MPVGTSKFVKVACSLTPGVEVAPTVDHAELIGVPFVPSCGGVAVSPFGLIGAVPTVHVGPPFSGAPAESATCTRWMLKLRTVFAAGDVRHGSVKRVAAINGCCPCGPHACKRINNHVRRRPQRI